MLLFDYTQAFKKASYLGNTVFLLFRQALPNYIFNTSFNLH